MHTLIAWLSTRAGMSKEAETQDGPQIPLFYDPRCFKMFLSWSEWYYPIPWVTQLRCERDSLRQRVMIYSACPRHIWTVKGMSQVGWEQVSTLRLAHVLVQTCSLQQFPRFPSQWAKYRLETLGHGSHHRDLAGSHFYEEGWLRKRK